MKFVFVHQLVVPSAELTNRVIVLIHESNMSMTMAVARVVIAFEAKKDVLAVDAASLEVG